MNPNLRPSDPLDSAPAGSRSVNDPYAREKLELAMEAANLIWWEWQVPSGRIRTLGYADHPPPAAVVAIPPTLEGWLARVQPGDREAMEAKLAMMSTGEAATCACELQMSGVDGNLQWIRIQGRVIRRDAAGRPELVLGTARNINERRRAQERLIQAKEQAEIASRAKSEFLAVMSHEIRTPLNPILGVTQLLLETAVDEEQKEMLEMVFKASNHLLTLLTDILDLAKIEAGRIELRPVGFRLDSVLGDVLEIKREEARRRQLGLRLEVSEGMGGMVRGDLQRLRQVLLNLVGNAVKFTEQGAVTLRARPIPQPAGMSAGHTHTLWVRIEVEDSGIGIEPDYLPKLFEPFHQADTSMSRRYEGSGLGLPISHRLVSIMGGQIRVNSQPGRGSVFTVELPFEVDDPELAGTVVPLTAEAVHAQARKPVVLLVEDDASNRTVLTAMLRRLGCEVMVAVDGSEAVLKFGQQPADLILMDLQMPVMDGFQATVEIRRSGRRGAEVPIIAQTANAFSSDREACQAAGMQDFLTKPVNLAQLSRLLRSHLPRT